MEDKLSKNRGGSEWFEASDITPEGVGSLAFPLTTKMRSMCFKTKECIFLLIFGWSKDIHVLLNCIYVIILRELGW